MCSGAQPAWLCMPGSPVASLLLPTTGLTSRVAPLSEQCNPYSVDGQVRLAGAGGPPNNSAGAQPLTCVDGTLPNFKLPALRCLVLMVQMLQAAPQCACTLRGAVPQAVPQAVVLLGSAAPGASCGAAGQDSAAAVSNCVAAEQRCRSCKLCVAAGQPCSTQSDAALLLACAGPPAARAVQHAGPAASGPRRHIRRLLGGAARCVHARKVS